MNALVLALALVTRAAAPAPVAHDVWITIDRDVLNAFERGGDAWESTALGGGVELPRPQVVAVALSESRITELAGFIHERYHRCGGFMWHASREEALAMAAGMAYSQAIEQAAPPVTYTIDNGPVARALIDELQELNIRNTIINLSSTSVFTRYHNCASGNASALSIRDQWAAMAAGRADVSVQLFTHTGYTTLQPSVILTITGTTFPSEVMVLGAHQDSIVGGSSGTNCLTARSPGADDDASGIATITEVLRAAMTLGYHPQRTVKFMAYAAEEIGLRGSAQIAQQHLDQGINVVGVVQFDMTNYSDAPRYDIVIYTDFTNAAQNAFMTQLANIYVPFLGVFPRATDVCGYGCSDHASWNNRGFPASLPFEAPFNDDNPYIHSSQDTIDKSGNNANRALPFAKLAAAYMAELAKGAFVPLQQDAGPRATARRAPR